MAFCAYSKQTRVENAPYRFVQASYMIIRASASLARDSRRSPSLGTTSNQAPPEVSPYAVDAQVPLNTSEITLYHTEPLSVDDVPENAEVDDAAAGDDYGSVRPAVLKVLEDLEGFLAAPVSRAAEFRPTTAMLAECTQAVHALAERDRQAVAPGLISALSEMVGFAASASARADPGYVRDG